MVRLAWHNGAHAQMNEEGAKCPSFNYLSTVIMTFLPDCRSPRPGLGTAPASPVIIFVRTEQLAVPTHLGREVGRVPYACTWFLVGLRPALCRDLALAHSPAVSPSLLIPVCCLIHLSLFPSVPPDLSEATGVRGREKVLFYSHEGNGTPLQYSCLENPMDGGAC